MINAEAQKITVAFDFDGTICDSYIAALEAFNELSQEYHFKSIAPTEFKGLKNLSTGDMIGYLGIEPSAFPEIVKKVVNSLHSKIDNLHPIVGIEKALHELRKQGYKIGVLTSNSERNVRKFAANNRLEFDFVYGDASLFGKHDALIQMLKDLELSPPQVRYVGDETRDIEAAHRVGIQAIAVSWGFTSLEILKKQNPDRVVSSPAELIDALL